MEHPFHVRISKSAIEHIDKQIKELGLRSKKQYMLYLLEKDGFNMTVQDM